ncbi:MAG: hypothetical protein SFV54_13250 [Bryobacteraceae bacterium]|nr:hypothetical protein [Bryobacteraceae bacterium]
MRHLWRALTLIAKDPVLREQITGVANCIAREDLIIPPAVRAQLPPQVNSTYPSLSPQPDFAAVDSITQAFFQRGVPLGLYEACEINRWLFENKTRRDGQMSHIREFWNQLAPFHTAHGDNADFQALAGILAIDTEFRFDFANNNASVSQIGFTLSPAEEQQLRGILANGGIADQAARLLTSDSWPTSCVPVAKHWPGWVHLNQ